MNKRKGMPTRKKIYNYWFSNPLLDQYSIELGGEGDCFACGYYLKVERCHILPINQGGHNSEENLHLLCPSCHVESEDLTGDLYWNWLSYMNTHEYTTAIERAAKKIKSNPEMYKQIIKDLGFKDTEMKGLF